MTDQPTQPDHPPVDDPTGGTETGESTAPAAPAESPTAPEATPPAVASPAERRALKLVVTCRPEGDGCRVVLAVGADACDPVFRHATADGLLAALDEVPTLLVAAEEQWRVQPRYPAAARPRTGNPRQRADAAAAAQGQSQPVAAPPAPAAKTAPAGQMALFG